MGRSRRLGAFRWKPGFLWAWVPGGVATLFLLGGAVASGGANLKEKIFQDGRVRGNPAAPLTLIEFSDFTCGYCLKFFNETWPLISLKYVETGKLRFMYRDFPRASEGLGLDAAVAARCAGDQNQYWQMHDRLFGSGRSLQFQDLHRYAQVIGLDRSAFSQCLEERRHRESIFRDRDLGTKLGFRGTPGFILIRTQDLEGTSEPGPIMQIPGAFPFEVFEEQIDRLLGEAAQKGKG
jgi:protein-disulfide isomerase